MVTSLPRVGRQMVRVNERILGERIGCHRTTVARMLTELEADGYIRRFKRKGRDGLLIVLLDRNGN